MYINHENINNTCHLNNLDTILSDDICEDKYNIIQPHKYYSNFKENGYNSIKIKINDVFKFSDDIILNTKNIFNLNISNYISIHLRLGDKYLEINKPNVSCDSRKYNKQNFYNIIEQNYDKNIIFFCDNNSFKQELKKKYNNIIILNSKIGHTAIRNTTYEEVLDTITEFYIMTNSDKIYGASFSGFSIVASKYNNIPYIKLY